MPNQYPYSLGKEEGEWYEMGLFNLALWFGEPWGKLVRQQWSTLNVLEQTTMAMIAVSFSLQYPRNRHFYLLVKFMEKKLERKLYPPRKKAGRKDTKTRVKRKIQSNKETD